MVTAKQTAKQKKARDALIAKIKALLVKTEERGCSPAEAMLAAKKVIALMRKHGVGWDDVQSDGAEMTVEEMDRFQELEREELAKSACRIIDSGAVLAAFEVAWSRLVAGEVKNAKLLFLVGTSRLFSKCMSAAVKGPSSAGKSELRKRVLNFFPPESVISFTTLSERALLYYEQDFPHMILSMGEASGTDEQSLQDYLLRELISEGKLRYPVVQKVGCKLETVIVEKNGPVAFLVTTTRAALHPENETRMLSLEVDDSESQTKKVLAKVAHIVGMNAEGETFEFKPWHDFQRWLAMGNCSVVIPFAGTLAKKIPPRSVRLRRDFSQILLAVKAHALLHRNHRRLDRNGQIVADVVEDYGTVAALMSDLMAEAAGTAIKKAMQETIAAVAELTEGLGIDEGCTADKVAKALKLDRASAWRRLKAACFEGFIVNLEVRHRQPGRYRVADRKVDLEEILPTPEAMMGSADRSYPSAIGAIVQSAQITEAYQSLNDCKTDCKTDCMEENAIGNAIGTQSLSTCSESINSADCTIASISGGYEREISDGDPFASLKDKSLALQLDDDPLADLDIPECLDRRGRP